MKRLVTSIIVAYILLVGGMSFQVYANGSHDSALSFIKKDITKKKHQQEVMHTIYEEVGIDLAQLHMAQKKPPETLPSKEEVFEVVKPPKIIQTKSEPRQSGDGLLKAESVESVSMDQDISSRCSLISKNNLTLLTGLPFETASKSDYASTIPQGHATDLISYGVRKGHLYTLGEKLAKQELMHRIRDHVYGQDATYSVFDMYMHTLSQQDYYLQSHRAVMFVGHDDDIYIIDPIRGNKQYTAQLLEAYIDGYDLEDTAWYSNNGYQVDTQIVKEYIQEHHAATKSSVRFDVRGVQEKVEYIYNTAVYSSLLGNLFFHAFIGVESAS